MKTEELLKVFDEASKEANKERALYNLLKANEKDITGIVEQDPIYFMKAFRQTDVCVNGYMDMAIWILLDEAKLFWEVFDKLEQNES